MNKIRNLAKKYREVLLIIFLLFIGVSIFVSSFSAFVLLLRKNGATQKFANIITQTPMYTPKNQEQWKDI